MKQTVEEAASENILFNHRTVDRTLSGKDLAKFGEMNFVQGAEWKSKQSLWISVKERLPEPNKEVLLYDKNSIRHYVIGWLRRDKGYNKGMWALSNGWIEDKDITHWMPIDKPIVSIRPRACFSPSYNKVKSQTCFVWLLTLL